MVRGERFGVGTARNRVQHRRFHLQETVPYHEVPDAAHRLAARHKTLAGELVGHQVNVALAVLDLLVMHAMKFVRHRAQALDEQAHLRGMDRQFTGTGAEHVSPHTDDIAEVPVLEVFVDIGADILAFDINLHATAAVLQGGKTRLAHDTLEHHPAGELHAMVLRCQFVGGCQMVVMQQGGGGVCWFEVVWKCHRPATSLTLAYCAQLFATLREQLVFIREQLWLGWVGHGLDVG